MRKGSTWQGLTGSKLGHECPYVTELFSSPPILQHILNRFPQPFSPDICFNSDAVATRSLTLHAPAVTTKRTFERALHETITV